jgi:hypothetical protein
MGPLGFILSEIAYCTNDDPGGTPGELDPPPHEASSGVAATVDSSSARKKECALDTNLIVPHRFLLAKKAPLQKRRAFARRSSHAT